MITEWALQSYLDLKKLPAFTDDEYWNEIRPDVELLRGGLATPHPKLQSQNFWSPANLGQGRTVAGGFKMKWHNKGPGKVQLRLCVAIRGDTAYLCQAYVKTSSFHDHRNAALLEDRIGHIQAGRHTERGRL